MSESGENRALIPTQGDSQEANLMLLCSDGAMRDIPMSEFFRDEKTGEGVWSVMACMPRIQAVLGKSEVDRIMNLNSGALDRMIDIYAGQKGSIFDEKYFLALNASPSAEEMQQRLEKIDPNWKEVLPNQIRMGLASWLGKIRFAEARKREGIDTTNTVNLMDSSTLFFDSLSALSEQDFRFFCEILSSPSPQETRLRDELLNRAKQGLRSRLRRLLLGQ